MKAHVQENKTSQQEEQIQQKKTQTQRRERVIQWSLIGLFALIWGMLLRLNFHETGESWVVLVGWVASVILMLELEWAGLWSLAGFMIIFSGSPHATVDK